MRIGLIEFLLILAIASLTVGPRVALFVDRWMRRANRANAMAARRRAEYAAQMAAERDAMLKRFRTASTVFGVGILLVLVYALGFRPIDTPPQTYKAPDLRQETGAMQTAVSTDRKTRLELGEYQGVDCIRAKDGLLYAAAWDGAALKKRTSDLVRTDGGHAAAILSVEGELTGFAFDAAGDVWLTQLTTAGGTLCRAKHDSWGAAVEQVVTQLDGAPLGAVSAVEVSPAGKVYFAVAAAAGAENGLESALRTELLAHTATGCVYVYDPAARTVEKVLGIAAEPLLDFVHIAVCQSVLGLFQQGHGAIRQIALSLRLPKIILQGRQPILPFRDALHACLQHFALCPGLLQFLLQFIQPRLSKPLLLLQHLCLRQSVLLRRAHISVFLQKVIQRIFRIFQFLAEQLPAVQVCLHPFQAFRFRISNEVILFQKIPHRFHSLFGLLPVLGILYIASFSILGNAPVQTPVGFQCFPQFFEESIVIALVGIKAVKHLP